MISECSMAMYLYKTHKQDETWKKEHDEIRACCKPSYEATFINERDELNYKKRYGKVKISSINNKKC